MAFSIRFRSSPDTLSASTRPPAEVELQIDKVVSRITPRVALLVSLGVAWINFLFTVKSAHLPGALNGWKRPLYAMALIVATVMAVRGRRMGTRVALPGLPLPIAGGWVLLARGAVAGWQWNTLGGYHTSAALSQSLT